MYLARLPRLSSRVGLLGLMDVWLQYAGYLAENGELRVDKEGECVFPTLKGAQAREKWCATMPPWIAAACNVPEAIVGWRSLRKVADCITF